MPSAWKHPEVPRFSRAAKKRSSPTGHGAQGGGPGALRAPQRAWGRTARQFPPSPTPAATRKPRTLLPPAVPLPSLRRRASRGPPAVNGRGEGGGRASGSGFGAWESPGAPSAPRAGESPAQSHARRSSPPHVPAARRAAHPATARRRRGWAAPTAIPSAPARPRQPISAVPPRGALRRGRGVAAVRLFRSALGFPGWRSRCGGAGGAQGAAVCAVAAPQLPRLGVFTAARSWERKVVVPSRWKFVCRSCAPSSAEPAASNRVAQPGPCFFFSFGLVYLGRRGSACTAPCS